MAGCEVSDGDAEIRGGLGRTGPDQTSSAQPTVKHVQRTSQARCARGEADWDLFVVLRMAVALRMEAVGVLVLRGTKGCEKGPFQNT